MPIIDQTKLPKEITDKYSIANNAFSLSKIKNAELDIYKNEPKDEINIVVGDDKVPDTFIPQLKLERWSNETNFSIRLIVDEVGAETVDTLADKIVWEKGNKKIEFYDFTEGEGGYKLVWFLKKKPNTNKVEFTIQSKGLDFFYQPELTAEEIAEGAVRPPEVVGSYAVYHSTKGGMNDVYGKEYKTGKAFHIFRPHIIDAEGKETWGILHIENGIYSVEIPQEFLDNAVYPIKSNDTIGYTTIGSSTFGVTSDEILASNMNNTASANGTVNSIQIYGKKGDNNYPFQGAIYNSSSGLLSPQSATGTINSTTAQWWILNFTSGPSILNGSLYYPSIFLDYISGATGYFNYDSGSSGDSKYKTGVTYNSWPNPITFSNSILRYSIYATYTPSGGGSSFSPSISPSASPSVSPSASISPSASPSVSPSASISPSKSPSLSPSISPSVSPSVSPSASFSPSISPSLSPSKSPSLSPSLSPSVSPSASLSPSISPSLSPSKSPSLSPSLSPSVSPSQSLSPSLSPSISPSISPSVSPSTAYVAVLKRWTGSAWARAKLLTYGTSFTAKPLKVRIGSDWGLVDISG